MRPRRGRVLWEWASGDATWALLLVKGAIAMAPDDPGDGEVAPSAASGRCAFDGGTVGAATRRASDMARTRRNLR